VSALIDRRFQRWVAESGVDRDAVVVTNGVSHLGAADTGAESRVLRLSQGTAGRCVASEAALVMCTGGCIYASQQVMDGRGSRCCRRRPCAYTCRRTKRMQELVFAGCVQRPENGMGGRATAHQQTGTPDDDSCVRARALEFGRRGSSCLRTSGDACRLRFGLASRANCVSNWAALGLGCLFFLEERRQRRRSRRPPALYRLDLPLREADGARHDNSSCCSSPTRRSVLPE
jgi:hypothetical protein